MYEEENQWRQEWEEQNDAYDQCLAEDIHRFENKEQKEWQALWEEEQQRNLERVQQESWWCQLEEKRDRVPPEPSTAEKAFTLAFKYKDSSKVVRRFPVSATVSQVLDFAESHPCVPVMHDVQVHYVGKLLTRLEQTKPLQKVLGCTSGNFCLLCVALSVVGS